MMTVVRRFAILAVVVTAMLLPRGASASTAACCIVKNNYTKNTMGCLARQIPDSEISKVKANPAQFAASYCNISLPTVSLTATLAIGACDTQPAATKCSAPPDQNKPFLDFKKQWEVGGFCAYKGTGSTSYDACSEVTNNVCPGGFNYGNGEFFSGPRNGAFCPASNPADFSAAIAAGNNIVPGKEVVADSMDACVYYVGDKYSDEAVVTCSEPEAVQGKKVCPIAPTGQGLQPSPQHPTEIKACQLSQHCCVVYEDTDNSDSVAAGEVRQCSPANVSCSTFVYTKDAAVTTANTKDAGTAYDKVLYRTDSVQKTCGEVPVCSGKTISTAQALANLIKNAGQTPASGLTPEQKAELEAASKNGPVWTQALCEVEANNVWSPPNPSITVGPYCYTNPDKAKTSLAIPIAGLSVASLATYIPNLFNYGLGLLATMTVLAIIFAGFQWATAAGNASAVGNAKEIMISAFAALFVALGSFTLLQTISPSLLEFKLPPIAAILPIEFYGKGDEFMCCNERGVCLQVEATGPNTFVVLRDGTKMEVGKNVDQAKCLPFRANGEFCRQDGPTGDACRKVGGTCTVGSAEDLTSITSIAGDKATQGMCSIFLESYVGGAATSVFTLANSYSFGITGWLGGKVGNAFKSEEDLIAGSTDVGRCYKNVDRRVAGQYCRANSECASGTCVRLPDSDGCYVDREIGICSDGNKGDVCDPLGHTLVGGVNTYVNKNICRSGLSCNFVRNTTGGQVFADRNLKVVGNYFECGDGSMNSACGNAIAECKDPAQQGKGGTYLTDDVCETWPEMLNVAKCKYEGKRIVVEEMVQNAGILNSTVNVAWGADLTLAVGSLAGGGLAKLNKAVGGYATAVAAGLTLANGVSQAELSRNIAEMQRYAYAVAFTGPDVKNCSLSKGTPNDANCKNGMVCTPTGALKELRCQIKDGGKKEGDICSYIGAMSHEFNGLTNSVSNGDNCDESLGLRCSVARIGEGEERAGFCTRASWGSKCILAEGKTWDYEEKDCSEVSKTAPSDLGKDNVADPSSLGELHRACYRDPSSTNPTVGKCGAVRNLYEEDIAGFKVSLDKMILFKIPGGTGSQAPQIVEAPKKTIGSLCSRRPMYEDNKTTDALELDCAPGLASTGFAEWAKAKSYAAQTPFGMGSGTTYFADKYVFNPVCHFDTPQTTIGKCAILVGGLQKDAAKGGYLRTLYAPFDSSAHSIVEYIK
ncbi:MAG: hypothetical protein AAB384_03075 [Patescibacteria group bacterium]